MRRRFRQQADGSLVEVKVAHSTPIHRDTFGKQEIPAMVEAFDRAKSERLRREGKQRKQALVDAVNRHA